MILEEYEIDARTIALCPAKEIEYYTLVISWDGVYKVRKTPYELIVDACEKFSSTYTKRREDVAKKKKFKRKVPIPISPERGIYAFPTHAPKHYDCYWIFVSHIARITRDKQSKEQTTLIFKNLHRLRIPLTYYSIVTQYERTLACLEIYEELHKNDKKDTM